MNANEREKGNVFKGGKCGPLKPLHLSPLGRLAGKVIDEYRDRRIALAAKQIREVLKLHRLTEGEMWSALGTAGTSFVNGVELGRRMNGKTGNRDVDAT